MPDDYDYESFWQRRKQVKNVGLLDNPDELVEAACQYFKWVTEHPLKESMLFHYKGAVRAHDRNLLRPFTITGLCTFIGVDQTRYREWAKEDKFKEAVAFINDVIYTQKFEGAAAGLLNANIISRDLGLAEKRELTGADGGPIETKELSARDILAERLAALAPTGGTPDSAE